MKAQKHTQALLLFALFITLAQCDDDKYNPCDEFSEGGESDDVVLYVSDDDSNEEDGKKWRKTSRVCLPEPCSHLKAFSGFIPVDQNQLLFFLHIKAKDAPETKPLLLWLQGGPGKSSLYGEFLENGPLGINASGGLFYREHTLLTQFNILYLDQPVGAGYSFGKYFPGSLEEATIDVIMFLKRFLRIFREYRNGDIYVAGESYGARSAVGVAHKILTKYDDQVLLKLGGVMLGVGFVFPLLEIINSADYLLYSTLLDQIGNEKFSQRFQIARMLAEQRKNYTAAAGVLSHTVLNMQPPGQKSLFQTLTGFDIHASIAYTETPPESLAYFQYANSSSFKKRIHVSSKSHLDGKRFHLAMNLSEHDFFVDIENMVQSVLNNSPAVLFYTGQFDNVFPAANLENQLRKLSWESSEMYRRACRTLWRRNDEHSGPLHGYEKKVPGLLSATVLFGGHYIFQDRSQAVSELYRRFLKFPRVKVKDVEKMSTDNRECYMMKISQ